MKKLTLSIITVLAMSHGGFCASLSELGQDVVAQSKITLMDKAQVGAAYNLKHDDQLSHMAVLGIWQYRFLSFNAGWSNVFDAEHSGVPALLAGFSIDKATRLIAPGMSDSVQAVIPQAIRPFYDKLVLSYGPGYDLDRGEWTHFLCLSLEFGDLPVSTNP